jgi:hypothetical protein
MLDGDALDKESMHPLVLRHRALRLGPLDPDHDLLDNIERKLRVDPGNCLTEPTA